MTSFVRQTRNIILGARSVVVKLESVTTDYDRDLKRYTCQLNVQFDRRALTAILMLDAVDKVEKENPSLTLLTDVAINKNDKRGVDAFFGAVRKAAEARASSISKVFLFSVQPKDPEGVDQNSRWQICRASMLCLIQSLTNVSWPARFANQE